MSEQVTVNAAWLAELQRENQRLREALDGLVSALHTETIREQDKAIDVAEEVLAGDNAATADSGGVHQTNQE